MLIQTRDRHEKGTISQGRLARTMTRDKAKVPERKLQALAFTQGRNIPSARFRVRQYLGPLQDYGVELKESFPNLTAYPPRCRAVRPFWAVAALAERFRELVRCGDYDLVVLQREMISTVTTLEGFTKSPRVLDVDDAIWLRQRRSGIDRIARICDGIICGNDYIAEYFTTFRCPLTVLPTAVDTGRFRPSRVFRETQEVIIGWTGSDAAIDQVRAVEPAIRRAMDEDARIHLQVVSDRPPSLKLIPREKLRFCEWSQNSEVESIESMDVGIMPLDDTPWNRGKCSYKLLLYMACGVPFICSPIGMNQHLVRQGCGVPANTSKDWTEAIVEFARAPELRASIGRRGRHVAESEFSVEAIVPRLAHFIAGVAGLAPRALAH